MLQCFTDIEAQQQADGLKLSDTGDPGDSVDGTPVALYVRNTGDSYNEDVQVGVEGKGAKHIQLAVDKWGEPGAWVGADETIKGPDVMGPGQQFRFWVRGIYGPGDGALRLPFSLVVDSINVV